VGAPIFSQAHEANGSKLVPCLQALRDFLTDHGMEGVFTVVQPNSKDINMLTHPGLVDEDFLGGCIEDLTVQGVFCPRTRNRLPVCPYDVMNLALSGKAILNYNQPQANGSNLGSMVIDMFKGGLRFATGLIGKVQPQNIKVRTATATVGIRGTVFDLVCAPAGSSDSATPAELGDMPCEESLLAQTREGLVALSGSQGESLLLTAGQSGRVRGPNAPAIALSMVPGYFQTQDTPAPEKISADLF